jgi:hypothetical protein
LRAALAALLRADDAALERPWTWNEHELDVRYGFYRQFEALEDARTGVIQMLSGSMLGDSVARRIVAGATAARWDLHGLIAPLTEDELDRDPGDGEWTIRQTLAHIVGGQRAYGLYTAWWLSNHFAATEELPPGPPDDLDDELPRDEEEAPGSTDAIDLRLGETLDAGAGVFAALPHADLAWLGRWSGVPVTAGFRLGRWSSHIREHTIQVEKTLGFIGRQPTEVERLVRLIAGAYGRLEQDVFLVPTTAPAVSDALALVESTAAGIESDARSVVEAAG